GDGTNGYTISNEQLGISTSIQYANRSRSKIYLAVGTYGDGIHFFRYDGENTRELVTIMLPGETVTSISFDTQQSIWVSTLDNGVFRIDRGYEAIRNPGYSLKLPDTSIRSGIVAKNGYMWLGTRTGWIYAINPDGDLAWSGRINLAPIVSSVESMYEKPDGSILVGTASGLFALQPNPNANGTAISPEIAFFENQTPAHTIKSIAMLNGDIITGTNTSLVRYFHEASSESETIAYQRITDVLVGPDESVWVGTTRGLYRYFDEILEICGIPFLQNTQINSITRLWGDYIGIATYGEGVILIDITDNSYHIIDSDHGLSDNLINAISYDGSDYLWVATSTGLNRISLSPEIELGPQIDRLPNGINIYSGSLFDMQILHIMPRGDQVWLGGSSGLFTLMRDDPGELELVIPLHFEEVLANDKMMPLDTKKNVNHDQNEWNFNFSGILFRDNQRLNYRYRLHNLAEDVPDWSITQNSGVSYRSVPPGDYKFEVQAYSADGKVNSEAVYYEFKINRAWWMLPWVWLLVSLLIVASIILTFQMRVRQVQHQEKEKNAIQARINELELQALQAMMNPHFVFNILNNIRYQILLDDKEKASDLLVDFSKLIRMQLDMTYKRQISISEEIERLKLYVMMESVRILHPIHFEYSFDENVDPQTTKIPSMLLQPFVENAIIHGIIPKNREGTIKINIDRAENKQLKVSICDDGSGIKEVEPDTGSVKQDRLSLGTVLIKERLELLAKEKKLPWKMNMSNIINTDGKVGGACVQLLLPIV
ncbi:MAG: histidine kinase, partial [Balneolales bacterium]|nr:histidine kinase [Balneolales bacterium]